MSNTDAVLVCSDCGSADVDLKFWVNINKPVVLDTGAVNKEDYDKWCHNCMDYVEVTSETNFLESRTDGA